MKANYFRAPLPPPCVRLLSIFTDPNLSFTTCSLFVFRNRRNPIHTTYLSISTFPCLPDLFVHKWFTVYGCHVVVCFYFLFYTLLYVRLKSLESFKTATVIIAARQQKQAARFADFRQTNGRLMQIDSVRAPDWRDYYVLSIFFNFFLPVFLFPVNRWFCSGRQTLRPTSLCLYSKIMIGRSLLF